MTLRAQASFQVTRLPHLVVLSWLTSKSQLYLARHRAEISHWKVFYLQYGKFRLELDVIVIRSEREVSVWLLILALKLNCIILNLQGKVCQPGICCHR